MVLRLEGVPILWFLEQVMPYIGPYIPDVEKREGGNKGRPRAKAQATPTGSQQTANAFKEWRSQNNTKQVIVDDLIGSIEMIVMEDNEAVIKIVRKGRSTKLRHIQRTHRIVLDWTTTSLSRTDAFGSDTSAQKTK